MALRKFFDSAEARDSSGRWTSGSLRSPTVRRKLDRLARNMVAKAPPPAEPQETPEALRPGRGGGEAPPRERRSLVRSSLAARSSKTLIPASYTGSTTPEPAVDGWKSLQVRWQPLADRALHEDTKEALKQIVRGEREGAIEKAKVLRQLVAVHGYKDRYQLKRRTGPLTLDPDTPRGAANRAYNHAAMLALHDFGIVDYDPRMSDAQKTELTPLVGFMRFTRRRLWNAMRQEALKGRAQAYRAEYGQKFPRPKYRPDGTERLRVRPNLEFIKGLGLAVPVAPPARARGLRNSLAKLLSAPEVTAAARSVQIPSEAQAKAGNYQKGHLRIGGLAIAIETPRGRMRRGVGPDGRRWAVKMPSHYGYVKRTTGNDGDQVDIYLGPLAHHAPAHPVFVIDQVNDKRAFDEHKAMLGFANRAAAMAAYDGAFSDGRGPQRRAAVCRMSWPEFRGWLAHGDTTKPLIAGHREHAHA